MFLNLLFVVMILCQAMEIWLRVSVIAENMLESQILEDFAQIAETRFSVGYDDNLKIFIFENNQLTLSIQIQDKLGKWILMLIQEDQIIVDGKKFKIAKQDQQQIQFFQIMRNWNNFFIEVQQNEKYNNFLLKQNYQQFIKLNTFNTFISDQNAIIMFWFKFLIDYNTTNSVYFKHNKNHQTFMLDLLQIERLVITVLTDQNNQQKEQQEIFINGMIWNQIQITLNYDQICLDIRNKFQQVIQICKRDEVSHIINKELVIEQQGLYVGHYSISYKMKMNTYYCSPGCIYCINKKCIECQKDQQLFDNQCSCQKNHLSQNIDGRCKMLDDLYEKRPEIQDNDIFNLNECQFGYIKVLFENSQFSECIKCPWFQNQLCTQCLSNKEILSLEILNCDFVDEEAVFEKKVIKKQLYNFEHDLYIPGGYSKSYMIISKKNRIAKKQISKGKSIQSDVKTKKYAKLTDQTSKQCPFNCECSLISNQLYCMNLIDNKDYTQSSSMGIPLFLNNQLNIFNIEIIALEIRNGSLYLYNKQNYYQLNIIINSINIDSIILTGIHVIQFVIDLQKFNYVNQVIYEINQEISKLRDHILIIRQSRKYFIPLINLIMTQSAKLFCIQDWKGEIKGFNKLTISSISFNSCQLEIILDGHIIILKDLYFNNTQISFQINCDKLIIENVGFENITGKKFLFEINSVTTHLSNILITNCTSNKYILFQMNTPPLIIQPYIIINGLLIQFSYFVDFVLFMMEKEIKSISLSNFILDNCQLDNSYILNSVSILYFKSIDNFKISESFISGSFFVSFQTDKINNFLVSNCKLNNIEQVIVIVNDDSYAEVQNIRLHQILLTQVQRFFFFQSIIHIQFISIQDIIMDTGTIFALQGESILGFISITNVSIFSLTYINCWFITIHHINIYSSSIDMPLFHGQSENSIVKQVLIKNMQKFQYLFELISGKARIVYVLVTDFQIQSQKTDVVFIKLISQRQYLHNNFVLIDHIKFCNNSFYNRNINFINLNSYNNIRLSNIFFNNNNISVHNYNFEKQEWDLGNVQNLIQLHSDNSEIISLYAQNLIIQQFQYPISFLDIISKLKITIVKIQFSQIMLDKCNLIQLQQSFLIKVEQFYFRQIQLLQSIFMAIQTSSIIIHNLTLFQMKTNDPLLVISSKLIYFENCSLNDIETNKDIIQLRTTAQYFFMIRLEFIDILVSEPSYILKEEKQLSDQYQIEVVHLDYVFINKCDLGLADLINCSIISVQNSKFSRIESCRTLINTKLTVTFLLSSTIISSVKLFYCPLFEINAEQSNKSISQVEVNNSIIQDIEYYIDENSSLLKFYDLEIVVIINSFFINNTCLNQTQYNAPLMSVTNYGDELGIRFSNTLFQLNNFTTIFQQESLQLSKIKTIKENYIKNQQQSNFQQFDYFFIYINKTLIEKSTKRTHPKAKLNINDYYLHQAFININQTTEYQEVNITREYQKQESVYLPSGQIMNKYEIFQLDGQNHIKYIKKIIFEANDSENQICYLNLIQVTSISSKVEILQSQYIKLNQDLSGILQFKMDPYNKYYRFFVELTYLNDQNQQQTFQYLIKPFPCQMGEYYANSQCNLCKIMYWQNTIKKNQNKCDQYDQNIVSEMKQGLLKLVPGYWRPDYHNKYFTLCEIRQNCEGGWNVGDQSCQQGHLGAQCSECDIYNKRGSGSFSKQQGQCIQCSDDKNSLIVYVAIVFCYQLISTFLACNKSYKSIQDEKLMLQQSKFYNILQKLQVDQITILLKILSDVYIKIILINQFSFNLPEIINISLNMIPTELVNRGLYCNIMHLGQNIVLLEVICIFTFTLVLVYSCNIIYMLMVFKKVINQSITYLATIYQYGYKQSYIYISQLQNISLFLGYQHNQFTLLFRMSTI